MWGTHGEKHEIHPIVATEWRSGQHSVSTVSGNRLDINLLVSRESQTPGTLLCLYGHLCGLRGRKQTIQGIHLHLQGRGGSELKVRPKHYALQGSTSEQDSIQHPHPPPAVAVVMLETGELGIAGEGEGQDGSPG